MKILKNKHVAEMSILTYILMVTVALSTTTNASRIFVEPIRVLSALALTVSLCALLFRTENFRNQINLLLVSVFFGLYGLILQLIHQGQAAALGHSFYNLVVIIIGAITLSYFSPNDISEIGRKFLSTYFLSITLLTIFTGGLILELPPRFNFEYLSDGIREEIYSLGISQYFGMGSVMCAHIATRVKHCWKISIYLILCLLYILLSILGGARGDSLIAVLMSLVLIARRFPFGSMLGLGFIAITAWLIDIGPDAFDQLVLYQRLVAGGGDLGDRDILMMQVFSLLEEQPACLLIGCGFSFFQYFFMNDLGMYPHNFIIELIITFGLPATILILIGTVIGIAKDYRYHRGLTYTILLFIYCAAVGLKSHSILTNWLMTAGLLYYFSRALSSKVPASCNALHVNTERNLLFNT